MSIAEAMGFLTGWRDGSANAPLGSPMEFFNFCLTHLAGSKAQLFQDLWVAYEFSSRPGGYFVEFGAGDGVTLSNTYFLEKALGWKGIIAEPGRSYYPDLMNKRDCFVDKRCVWKSSGERLVFNETEYRELSTIDAFSESDMHSEARKSGQRYEVETVSLNDLLKYWNAPQRIDYLSIDTEGSEFDILSQFDFNRFDVRLITVEHNFTDNRGLIKELLNSKGYVRKFEQFSKFDDWYLRAY